MDAAAGMGTPPKSRGRCRLGLQRGFLAPLAEAPWLLACEGALRVDEKAKLLPIGKMPTSREELRALKAKQLFGGGGGGAPKPKPSDEVQRRKRQYSQLVELLEKQLKGAPTADADRWLEMQAGRCSNR